MRNTVLLFLLAILPSWPIAVAQAKTLRPKLFLISCNRLVNQQGPGSHLTATWLRVSEVQFATEKTSRPTSNSKRSSSQTMKCPAIYISPTMTTPN